MVGDLITLSSDEELPEALSQLQEDSVWKLYVGARHHIHKSLPNQHERWSFFHNPFELSTKPFRLFSDIWSDLEEHLQMLLHLQSKLLFSGTGKTDKKKDAKSKPTSSSEAASTLEAEGVATSSSTEGQDEVV